MEKMKKMEKEKMEKEMEVKEEIIEENNKRRREKDEDSIERGPYKKNTVNKYFENICEHLANNETTLSEIFQRFPSMYARHYKTLERIVYERDRLKKRPVREVTWIYSPYGMGEIEWADKYLGSYDTFRKVGNYYLGITEYNKNLIYNPLQNEKYSDVLQMFTDNDMELKIKY
jgi:arylsulfatase A-like enzyme